MRAVVLLICAVVLCGCDAAAQNPPSSEDRLAESGTIALRRALRTRTVLREEGLVRDQAALVTAERCSQGQELLIPLDTPPACDELTIESLGTTYRAFLFSKGRSTLLIYHEGHNTCDPNWGFADYLQVDAARLMAKALDRADVLYFDMPLVATNCGQEVDVGEGAVYSGTSHNWFSLLDRPGESGLAYFFNHIYRTLDYYGPTYTTVHMVGRSGGGWATTIYAALDWRIDRSISVAGSLPLEFRGPDFDGRDDLGDWEQYGAYLFKIVKYQELYEAAGGTGDPRRHMQIYNEFDDCCFSGIKGSRAADDYLKSPNGYLQERVQFFVKPGDTSHAIPVEMVLAELFAP
jgi:hypothetical protein